MQIVLNGETRSLERALTVAELLEQHRLEPQRVAVEINQQLVRRALFGQTRLSEGDRVEIVTFVGGG